MREVPRKGAIRQKRMAHSESGRYCDRGGKGDMGKC